MSWVWIRWDDNPQRSNPDVDDDQASLPRTYPNNPADWSTALAAVCDAVTRSQQSAPPSSDGVWVDDLPAPDHADIQSVINGWFTGEQSGPTLDIYDEDDMEVSDGRHRLWAARTRTPHPPHWIPIRLGAFAGLADSWDNPLLRDEQALDLATTNRWLLAQDRNFQTKNEQLIGHVTALRTRIARGNDEPESGL